MLEVKNLTKKFNNIPVVNNVNFTVKPGDILGYLGPNGAGKSTTIKMITGLLQPTRGTIYYNGEEIDGDNIDFKRKIGKQQYFLSFIASCITVVTITATGVIGLYPNLIPSRIDERYSLTLFNSSSSVYTLKIMTVVALVFIPVVIGYQIWAYRVFRDRVTTESILSDKDAY